jgi:hypothetical protein
VSSKQQELGVLSPERGVVELRFARLEHDQLPRRTGKGAGCPTGRIETLAGVPLHIRALG